MSANKENNLIQAYLELNKYCASSDYERALKAAGKVLQIAPNEQKAFHCKVVCLIHMHNFKEALAALNNSKNAAVAADMHFEKAYTLYRLNSSKEALQTVDAAPELTPALKELRAQILYRLEQYQDCFNLYREIVKNTTDDYEDERQANMAAVVANLAAANPSADLPQFGESTYELCYNAGSTLAVRGKYTDACAVLKRADSACVASIVEDGGTEDEAKEETAIIRVQQAYCLQMLGKEKEAAAIYLSVLKDKPSDIALVAIASNNLVVINKDGNVFDSRKRMKAATQDGLEHKLTTLQRCSIAYNQSILALYSNQLEFCKQCCVKLVREFGDTTRATVVEASRMLRESRDDLLRRAAELLRGAGGELLLAAAHVLVLMGERKEAIKLLEESEYKYRPAVVGLLCTLLLADNDIQKASDLFADVLKHYTGKESEPTLRPVWRAAAEIHTKAEQAARLEATHKALLLASPHDLRTIATIVRHNVNAALHNTQLLERLPTLAEGAVDIDALENSKWMMGAKVVKKSGQNKLEQSPGTPAAELSKKKRSRRKRNTKLPPTADLSRPPDPERWLPKYERSAYRKRRGVRRDVIKGSQGMTTAATDVYDMSKREPTVPGGTPGGVGGVGGNARSPRVADPRPDAWQRKQQKKKAKGRKW